MATFTGKIWVLGDDIDTDIIIPTEYLALKTVDDMKKIRFFSAAPRTGRTNPAGRHHRRRKEFRVRFFP